MVRILWHLKFAGTMYAVKDVKSTISRISSEGGSGIKQCTFNQ
jgi:hypothetical protein